MHGFFERIAPQARRYGMVPVLCPKTEGAMRETAMDRPPIRGGAI